MPTVAKKKPILTQKKADSIEKHRRSSNEAQQESVLDYCGVKLTKLQREFLVHYCIPGQPCYSNAFQAAIKAGYKKATATAEIYVILKNPDIQRIIKTNERLLHEKIHESALRAIELKQTRAFYDPMDYFEEEEITLTTKDGDEYTRSIIGLKPLEKMTPEQRLVIDGMDIKGNASKPVYILADREKNLNDIIKLDSELSKKVDDAGEEETREIIMERITIRETKRKVRPADIEYEIVEMADLSEDEKDDD